jgi:hypothetical protein
MPSGPNARIRGYTMQNENLTVMMEEKKARQSWELNKADHNQKGGKSLLEASEEDC